MKKKQIIEITQALLNIAITIFFILFIYVLANGISNEKETIELEKEKLRLEIKLKQIELL